MTRLFRSKSCGLVGLAEFNSAPPSPFFNSNNDEEDDEDEDEEEEEDGQEFEEQGNEDEALCNPISTPLITTTQGSRANGINNQGRHCHQHHHQFAILDILVAALRKSIVTCSVEREDVSSSLDISWPTEVRHVSHVTFDRFNGFLGLPTELEPEVPRRVPSAR